MTCHQAENAEGAVLLKNAKGSGTVKTIPLELDDFPLKIFLESVSCFHCPPVMAQAVKLVHTGDGWIFSEVKSIGCTGKDREIRAAAHGLQNSPAFLGESEKTKVSRIGKKGEIVLGLPDGKGCERAEDPCIGKTAGLDGLSESIGYVFLRIEV